MSSSVSQLSPQGRVNRTHLLAIPSSSIFLKGGGGGNYAEITNLLSHLWRQLCVFLISCRDFFQTSFRNAMPTLPSLLPLPTSLGSIIDGATGACACVLREFLIKNSAISPTKLVMFILSPLYQYQFNSHVRRLPETASI